LATGFFLWTEVKEEKMDNKKEFKTIHSNPTENGKGRAKELEMIGRWLELTRGRAGIIGRAETSRTGEEFTTCGDLSLDSRVAEILLETIQSRLPQWGCTAADGHVVEARTLRPLKARQVQLLPSHLFTINWADSGPGFSWPESYFVTYVPQYNVRIVTASQDTDECKGYTDLAIGWCRPVGPPERGAKKIIVSWWRRGCGVPRPWQSFWTAGLIGWGKAEHWRREAYGSLKEYDLF
jgi:hypothetical protein